MRCDSTKKWIWVFGPGPEVTEKPSLIQTQSQPDYTGTGSFFVSVSSRPVGLTLLRDIRVRWPCGRVRTTDAYPDEYAPARAARIRDVRQRPGPWTPPGGRGYSLCQAVASHSLVAD